MYSVDIFWSFVKMISALAIILGLMFGAMVFFKRFMKNTGVGMDRGGPIRIVATKYLGPKNSIMLMEILGQVVVVGISNQQMTVLATMSDPAVLERLNHDRNAGPQMPSFSSQLTAYKEKFSAMKRFVGKGNREND